MPEYIRTMFADACKHPDGKRQRETDIINQLFTKKGKKLEMNEAKSRFEEGLKAYNRDCGRKEQAARPKLLKANEFPDGLVGVERAIKA